jgi:hypothetical protein
MRIPARLALAAFIVLAGLMPASAAIELSSTSKLGITNEYVGYNDHISGGDPGGSFLSAGDHFTDNLGLLYNAKEKDTAWESALDGRVTDDGHIEPHEFSLKRFYVKADTDRTNAVVGDYFGTFSQYTLGKNLKGAMIAHRFGEATTVTVVAGMDKPNWQDLWMNNASETVDRQVYGARVVTPLLTDGTIGFNTVWTKDERAKYDTVDLAQVQRVFGVDWALPPYHKLVISGESAYSHTQNDQPILNSTGVASGADQYSTQEGWAHDVKARYSYKRFKTIDEFERVSPDYATTVGSASPDLLRVKTANTLTITGPWKWIVFNYTYFHNNLANSSMTAITTTRQMESGLRYEGPDWRPDFSIESKLRDREADSTFGGLRDRTTSSISSVNDRLGPVSVGVDYEYQIEVKSDGSLSSGHSILGISSSMLNKFSNGWKLNEGLRWDLERDRDILGGTTDQTGTVKANAGATSPWGADSGASYSRSLVMNALTPGNDRRVWTASIGYNFFKNPNNRLELRFHQNDNRFQAPNMDYKETVWELALTNKI